MPSALLRDRGHARLGPSGWDPELDAAESPAPMRHDVCSLVHTETFSGTFGRDLVPLLRALGRRLCSAPVWHRSDFAASPPKSSARLLERFTYSAPAAQIADVVEVALARRARRARPV